MFGLFNNKKNDNMPEWAAEVQEAQQRWFLFLDKLEAKMKELCEAAIPELTQLYQNDPDIFHREYTRMKSGVLGQLEQMRQKAYNVHEEKIIDLYCVINESGVRATHPHYNIIGDFRSECRERHNQFEDIYRNWCDKIEATSYEDLEIKYQNILKEYDAIKDKFACKQCGSPITIQEIFFIDVFLACPSCQTQNTFSPSTHAKMLQHFAQDLARQRTVHLYEAFQNEVNKERELYHKKHENRELLRDDKKTAQAKKQQNEIWEQERQAAIANAPKLYEKYIRAKYEEWIKITPFQKEHLLQRMENDLIENRGNPI